MVGICQEAGLKVSAIKGAKRVALGVNTQKDLALASRYIFKEKAKELMDEGVILIDPNNTYIEDTVVVGPSTIIFPGAYLRGDTVVGSLAARKSPTVSCTITARPWPIVSPMNTTAASPSSAANTD